MNRRDGTERSVEEAGEQPPESWSQLVRDISKMLGVDPLSQRCQLRMRRSRAELFPDAEQDPGRGPNSVAAAGTPPDDMRAGIAARAQRLRADRFSRVQLLGFDAHSAQYQPVCPHPQSLAVDQERP